MACSRTSLPRALAATLTTALVSMILMLALAPVASARVTIVPGTAEGGKVAKLAVRLSNERPDVPSTRLELTFPKDVVIPRAEVARTGTWVATITMRPVVPAVVVNGKEVDKAVDSIVWTGGEVAPRQFEQFLVTAGPLPANGRLVFAATQGFTDGTVDTWSAPAEQGKAGAPTITLSSPRADRPAAAGSGTPGASTGFSDGDFSDNEGSSSLPWVLLAGGLLVAGAAGVVGYQGLRRRQKASIERPAATADTAEPTRAEVGRR